MESNSAKINNKEKQSAAHNWSSNKFVKKHTKIAYPLIPEKPTGRGLKRRKHVKKPYISPWSTCPFCGNQLEKLDKDRAFVFARSATKCTNCDAGEAPECPACKRTTWVNKEGLYKHKWASCGFSGKKKYAHT